MKKAFLFCAVCAVSVAVLACGAVPVNDPAQISRGEALFQDRCATCHGRGPGYPGTQALDYRYQGIMPGALEDRTNLTPEFVEVFVRNGTSIMPFFRKTDLSDAELADIGAYLSTPLVDSKTVAGGDAARGRAIIATGVHGCPACHTVPGIRFPAGIVGPPLGGTARRGFIAGQLPNRPDVLVTFLQNPPALVPETGMPDVGLTLDEARHIAAYLYTLEASNEP
jgi:mono/diheme cytochrome c family protein